MDEVIHLSTGMSEATIYIHGGDVLTWRVCDEHILFPHEMRSIGGILEPRGGLFACVPNFGATPKRFPLPKHGVLQNSQGIIVDKQTSSLTLLFSDLRVGEDTLSTYISYTITKTTLRVELMILPLVGTPYLNPGIHPYFPTPHGELTLSYPNGHTLRYDSPIPESTFPETAKVLKLDVPGVGQITLTPFGDLLLEGRSCLCAWSDSSDYFCVEPIAGLPEQYGDEQCFRLTQQTTFGIEMSFTLNT